MLAMRILQRCVFSDLLRIFSLSIFVLTVLLVVMGVAGEAAKNGLGAEQIIKIIPYIIPSLLPYTIPATLLLTVCIVYGRMAGDNEITAIKSAGINVYAVLSPSFVLGAALSLGTFILTDQFIPWGRANIERVVTLAMEDIFLDILRANSSYHDNPHGISIVVSGVNDRTLIDPVFRYRLQSGESATIHARQATIKFDLEGQQVWLTLETGDAETPNGGLVRFKSERQPLPMPVATDNLKAPRNMTIESIRREQAALLREAEESLQQQVIQSILALSEGAFDRLAPTGSPADEHKERLRVERGQKLRTEIHGRLALSCSCLFFVLIGSPFAIVQAKRQFLTNFALCFAPILLGYYPIVLLTMNLCREGALEPAWGMWLGNLGLAMAAAIVLRRVFRN
jgi:lipopolysaccharide export system permease protein